jgi:hypothetical protein
LARNGAEAASLQSSRKGKGKAVETFDFSATLHASENDATAAHAFEVGQLSYAGTSQEG